MHHPAHRFDVVLQSSSADERLVLRSVTDPNTATIAFHEELQRLTTQGATGELSLRKRHGAQTPVLRQPLDHPTRPSDRNRRT
jgi:hypothetical protein